jgi:hypothetical protein
MKLRTLAAGAALACAALSPHAVAKQKPLMKDFIGINGHFTFKPELYRPVCELVRNYHNMPWDVQKPGDNITFPHTVNGVNWEAHTYGPWAKAGFEIDVCAQFHSFGPSNKDYKELWKGQEEWVERYGEEMARFFGPSGERKLVTSIEIGNEPGNEFDDIVYRTIFKHMAQGIRKGDPRMKIVTCTTHAGESDKYSKDVRETFSSPDIKNLYDVINIHTYAIKPRKEGQSPWERSYPEDPGIDYLKLVDNTIAWRDKEAPGKEIWITEFGYDAGTEEALSKRTGWALKLNWRGVTELQQAQWLVRSFLSFIQRDVDRAYLYYFDDNDEPGVHASSGITRKFQPKPAYWAVKHFYETLGEFRLNRVVNQKAGEPAILEFVHGSDPSSLIWVAWLPTGENREILVPFTRLPGKPYKMEKMPVADGEAPQVEPQRPHAGGFSAPVGESPVYLYMKK